MFCCSVCYFQDQLWDMVVNTIFNFCVLGIVTGYLNHPDIFWPVSVIFLVLILFYFNKRKIVQCLTDLKFGFITEELNGSAGIGTKNNQKNETIVSQEQQV